jgi:hypothetical protein
MKNIFITTCFAFVNFVGYSQTVTPTVYASDGGSATSPQGSIAWTIGEPISETYTTPVYATTMGFHQTEITITKLIEQQGTNMEILVYPNPVYNELNLNLNGLIEDDYQLLIFDGIGKLVFQTKLLVNKLNARIETIKMDELANGNYFINIQNSTKSFSKTIKITKQ